MERKSCLIGLAIFLLPPILLFSYLFINSFIPKVNIYHIPQVDMYIKTMFTPQEHFGYILFGKSNNLSLSDSIDFIKVSKQINHEILIDANNKNKIYLRYNVRKIIEDNKLVEKTELVYGKKNPIHYLMIDIADTDTCFFKDVEKHCRVSKNSNMNIVIDEYFKSVKIRNINDSIYTIIKPLQ